MVPEDLERVLGEQALVRLRELLAERDDVVLGLLDADLRLQWSSVRGAGSIYRRHPDDVTGVAARDLVHPRDADATERALRQARHGATVSIEVLAHDADGRWMPVRVLAWPTVDRDAVVTVTVPLAGGEGDGEGGGAAGR